MPYQKNLYEPDVTYHLCNHANGFENLFSNKNHYLMFINRYIEYFDDIFETLAFTLMPNHYHLVVKVKSVNKILTDASDYHIAKFSLDLSDNAIYYNLSRFISYKMSAFLNGYVQKYNNTTERRGGLFRTDSKRIMVLDQKYLKNLIKYVHHNPVKHGFCKDPKDWGFSSYSDCLNKVDTYVQVQETLKIYGGYKRFLTFHLEKDVKDFQVIYESEKINE